MTWPVIGWFRTSIHENSVIRWLGRKDSLRADRLGQGSKLLWMSFSAALKL